MMKKHLPKTIEPQDRPTLSQRERGQSGSPSTVFGGKERGGKGGGEGAVRDHHHTPPG